MVGTDRDMRFSSTLARGLAVLRAFRPSDDGLGNQVISERTGIPKPTVCRLTKTLCADGYLTQGKRNDKYRLGPAALALGQIAGASFGFVDEATPVMQALANKTGVLVGIAIRDEDHMLMCKTWTPDATGREWMDVGYRMPISSSSSGRAFLAGLTDAAMSVVSEQIEPKSVAQMMSARQDARRELAESGFICVSGEAHYSQTIHAVAVPYCPAGMGAPVAFLAGAAVADVDEHQMRNVIGSELARSVIALKAK
ncbi:DNA-binding transcriptional regulator, IclR family [Shimia gijangensis]|uniref:DNA-binding transcriptional regulator, IclR family n=1 Tax=Shimia gijangensis TaxID=1470563 RepID=A0A1M6I874_9RHOB|nr:helix-turn-helix domain-containing protein [Shimia gijangensis]SHJ30671.1 DNA-binding transcriptional regulator, IclR family [Shimia gijangensis]